MSLEFTVEGKNFLAAGEASSRLKHTLQHIGFPAPLIRRVAVAAYEAEMNMIIHADRGALKAEITPKTVTIWAEDEGPGIPNIELAMQEGYSTAPDYIREMGFGAGMGLPNIKKCTDIFEINTTIGVGTKLKMVIFNKQDPGSL
ncbi:MAG: ATP-binding protein [Bacillota bacterium]|nr:ATP-binding protein [Bacillota bacterium]